MGRGWGGRKEKNDLFKRLKAYAKKDKLREVKLPSYLTSVSFLKAWVGRTTNDSSMALLCFWVPSCLQEIHHHLHTSGTLTPQHSIYAPGWKKPTWKLKQHSFCIKINMKFSNKYECYGAIAPAILNWHLASVSVHQAVINDDPGVRP